MASRAPNSDTTPTASSARRSASSSSMDLLGSSPSSTAPRANHAASSASSPAAAPARPSNTRENLPSAVRSPARLTNSPSARLSATSTPNRNAAAVVPPPSSTPAQSSVARQAEPAPSVNQLLNSPAPPAAASTPLSSSSTSQVSCKTATDCPSRICISEVCQISSGFALSVSTSPSADGLSSVPHAGGYRSKFGTPTACSDPRCTLPAEITSLNGAEQKDISASLGSSQRAFSSAATAGIVLAFLFATLAILLIVPKMRDWARRCFGCTKDDNGIVLDGADGSPEFGNHHVSAFINEKRQTLATDSHGSSYAESKRVGSRNGHSQTLGHSQGYSDGDEYLPGYEGGQGDIADVKVDLKQEEYYGRYHDQDTCTHYAANNGTAALPALDYDRSHSTRDLASYVEHNPPPPLPSSKSAPMQLSRATAAPAQYVPPVCKPANITPWSSRGRDAQVRETVLPYTVEEDRDVLQGLRALGTPAVNDLASNQQFSDSRDAYTTPVMRNNGFDNSLASPQTPITPGSAYSVRTALLPASLRPGQGQGRAPILKQGLAASRPAFKRLSNALRFDSNTKSS